MKTITDDFCACEAPLVKNDYRADTLTDAIERFIVARDDLWHLAAISADTALPDLHRLAVANRHVLRMLQLTAGPTTPVLPPDRAVLELKRAAECSDFIERTEKELFATKRAALADAFHAQSEPVQ